MGGANSWALSNTLPISATLTIGGSSIAWTGTATANQTLTLEGTGNTVLNAALPGVNSTFNLYPGGQYPGNGDPSTRSTRIPAGSALSEGTLIADAKSPFGTSAGTFTWAGGTLIADIPLTSGNAAAIPNPVTISNNYDVVSGTNSIEFSGTVGMAASPHFHQQPVGRRHVDFLECHRHIEHGGLDIHPDGHWQYADQRRLCRRRRGQRPASVGKQARAR